MLYGTLPGLKLEIIRNTWQDREDGHLFYFGIYPGAYVAFEVNIEEVGVEAAVYVVY